jgi:hypothetical protein
MCLGKTSIHLEKMCAQAPHRLLARTWEVPYAINQQTGTASS